MDFSVVQGDIAAQSADALVNAANTGLRMGSGVAGALREAGGEAVNDAAVAKGPIELGDVAVTDAYDLDADVVIHAAAMPAGGTATADSIRSATRNALTAAEDNGCASVVIPALGCGVAGFDLESGAHVIAEEIQAVESATLRDVSLIAYAEDEYETILAATQRFR
jgi:O-acetyl-ADP-ribose deacetylase (regulator of RNase III)